MIQRLFLFFSLGLLLLAGGCASRYDVKSEEMFFAERPSPMAPTPAPTAGAIYSAASTALFEDRRARKVGDILVVVLSEQTSAQKSSGTNVSKANETSITDPTLAGATRTINGNGFGFDLSSGHSFAGSSDSSQSNQLSGTIAVTVREVLTDGTLVIGGEKWVKLNRGNEFVRVSGLVRPSDVREDNSIMSTYVANARIAYSGTGETADANAMGWLSRFFVNPIWPF